MLLGLAIFAFVLIAQLPAPIQSAFAPILLASLFLVGPRFLDNSGWSGSKKHAYISNHKLANTHTETTSESKCSQDSVRSAQ